MNRIAALMERYEAAGSLAADGAEIVAVADQAGTQLNAALRCVILAARDDPGLLDDIIQPAKLLRWRLATHLQAGTHQDVVTEIEKQARLLRLAVTDSALLTDLASAARSAAEAQSPLADALLDMVGRTGPEHCLLVAATRPAQAALADFWETLGVLVVTAPELTRKEECIDYAFAIGPPRFFRAALITAPATRSVSFVIPSWIHDRTLPSSPITAYAGSSAMRIKSRTRIVGIEDSLNTEGGTSAVEETAGRSDSSAGASEFPDNLFPQPTWDEPTTPHREPRSDEVIARKILLDGGQAIWLDDNDGERIRTLDPVAPHGERVHYAKLATVLPGTFLLLRKGTSGYGAVDRLAAQLLGEQAANIDATQHAWKGELNRRIAATGIGKVDRDLRLRGIKSAGRAWAWTSPSLILPKNDGDFRALLGWLGIPVEPTISNAKRKRRAHHQAGTDVREKLEQAVEDADLSKLACEGRLDLRIRVEGFRDLVAARVLAVSPYAQVIPRHQARVLFNDRSSRWLE